MVQTTVLLNSIGKVKDFTKITEQIQDVQMDIACGRYIVDAKSIMGIFSLNLVYPLTLRIYADEERAKEIMKELYLYQEDDNYTVVDDEK